MTWRTLSNFVYLKKKKKNIIKWKKIGISLFLIIYFLRFFSILISCAVRVMVFRHLEKKHTTIAWSDEINIPNAKHQTPTGIQTGNELSAYCKDHWIDGRCVVVHFGRIYFSIIVFASACIMRSNANVRFHIRKGADVGNIASKLKLEGYYRIFVVVVVQNTFYCTR